MRRRCTRAHCETAAPLQAFEGASADRYALQRVASSGQGAEELLCAAKVLTEGVWRSGSACRLQRQGHRFEPCHAHCINAAQTALVRLSDLPPPVSCPLGALDAVSLLDAHSKEKL